MRLRIRVAASGGMLVLAAALVNSFAPRVASHEPPLDVVIMDPESGVDAARNVGIRGGRIVQIAEQPLEGKETIDAQGLVVVSGFIDLHQHGQNAENDAAKAADGVTTSLEMEVGTADIDRWYAAREGQERVNYGVSVGHIPVRMALMNNPGTFLPSGDAARPRNLSEAERAE